MMSEGEAAAATRTMTVSAEEMREVAHVASVFCTLDERRRAGSVLLAQAFGAPAWLLGHPTGVIAMRPRTITVDDDGLWVLPKRFINAAAAVGTERGITFEEAVVDGEVKLTLISDGVSATLPRFHLPETHLIERANETRPLAASVSVPVGDFANLVAAARFSPHDVDNDASPLFWVSLDDGQLALRIDWGEFGQSTYTLRGEGSGSATAAANPAQLADVLTVFDGTITIEMTTDPDDVMVLVSEDRRALISPVLTTHERLRSSVETLIGQAFGETSLGRDADGDYPIRQFNPTIYVRLHDDRPPRVQLFSILLDGVDETTDLYRELNELNGAVSFARLTWANQRVYATVDLVAATLDVDELLVAAERIRHVSSDFIPLVGSFHGGVQPDLRGDRWRLYRQTEIEAEVSPGVWQLLAGPGAIESWTLPDEVFVLSACNPLGTILSDAQNADATLALHLDLVRDGGRVSGAIGRAYDGSYSEGSLLMWGLPIEAVKYFARRYQQDAVFRLTASTMELISCDDDRRESWPRTETSVTP